MTIDLGLLTVTAASIGFIHTLLGPDHYVPFVAMGKARRWSLQRTLWITSVCGVGHVIGSIVIGFVGIGIGVSLHKLECARGRARRCGRLGICTRRPVSPGRNRSLTVL